MSAPRYTIEPQNEPDGFENGWHKCADENATLFSVYDEKGLAEVFDTRAEAEAWIRDAT